MAKPKSSNRSIRLTDEMWAHLNAEAGRRQTSVNGLVGDLLLVALHRADEGRAASPVRRDPSPSSPAPAKRTPKPTRAAPPKVIGYTASGEPIEAPAFVSRLKPPKSPKR